MERESLPWEGSDPEDNTDPLLVLRLLQEGVEGQHSNKDWCPLYVPHLERYKRTVEKVIFLLSSYMSYMYLSREAEFIRL